jgi:hypothetical protein
MTRPERESRPSAKGRPHGVVAGDGATLDRRADHELRIAWLRVHAELLYALDNGGQLSAALLDFADLLEAVEREGWWA